MQGLLEQLGASWARLNPREQGLAAIIGGLVLLMVAWSIISGAMSRLDQLGKNVDRLQEQIVIARRQILMRKSVEEHYAAVASQHSSAWDKYEVYERLRQEIFRLAQKVPPPLNEDGVPVRATNDTGLLVRIPELREGTMNDTDMGYREYKISFRIPEADLRDVFAFLERLHSSPQSLRIDGLLFNRGWDNTTVSTTIDLTRIIVDGTIPIRTSPDEPEALDLTTVDIAADRWIVDGGTLSPNGTGVTLKCEGERASMYMEAALPATRTAEVVLKVANKGRAMLGVADSEDMLYPGAERLPDDGKPYEVRFAVSIPGRAGDVVTIRIPYLVLNGEGAKLDILSLGYRALEG
ncbi:MAG: hypothetical protein GC168_03580 [Candidatus Hydrogenedens sp.]|nr:hypothetical protein [Candidatus Hydrogenedens sp.]